MRIAGHVISINGRPFACHGGRSFTVFTDAQAAMELARTYTTQRPHCTISQQLGEPFVACPCVITDEEIGHG